MKVSYLEPPPSTTTGKKFHNNLITDCNKIWLHDKCNVFIITEQFKIKIKKLLFNLWTNFSKKISGTSNFVFFSKGKKKKIMILTLSKNKIKTY